MNPYAQRRIKQYNELKDSVEALQTRAAAEDRDMTDDELRAAQGIADDAKKIYGEIQAYKAADDAKSAVESMRTQVMSAVADQHVQDGTRKVVGGLFATATDPRVWSMADAAMRSHGRSFSTASAVDQLRTTIGVNLVGGPTAGGFDIPGVAATLFEAAGGQYVQTLWRGAAGMKWPLAAAHAAIAESGSKPAQENPTALTIANAKYARAGVFTQEDMWANPLFLPQLARQQANDLRLDVDTAFITAITSGATAVSGSGQAAIRQALGQVWADTGAKPTFILVNPADYPTISSFAATNSDDIASFADVFGTAKIFPTNLVAANTVFVGTADGVVGTSASGLASNVYPTSPGTNEFTMVSELAVGFGVVLAGSIANVTLS